MTQTSGASRRGNANVYPKQALIRKCFHCLKIAFHRHHHCTPFPGRRAAASPESITTIGSMDSGPAPKRRVPE